MFLSVNNIVKQYPSQEVLRDISFEIDAQQTLSILGKSGCGKSTLLKILAGLEDQDAGSIVLNGTDISRVQAYERNIVYLFQEPMLFPHLNVYNNVAFGLKLRKVSSAAIKGKVNAILEQLDMLAHAAKMPQQLSGGQKQRIAFGRALVINPPLVLLDEPFSSLDVEIRASMQQLYKKIARQYNITALFVTHDLKEALMMGDRIAYMESGILKVYESPADFIRDAKTGVQHEIQFWKNLQP